jgi:hypothetical protein
MFIAEKITETTIANVLQSGARRPRFTVTVKTKGENGMFGRGETVMMKFSDREEALAAFAAA